uniref:Uncharacterized protein n=1 Tax=Oryza meridionalis TaxID=40149 RepID=A0A0E0C830_9ORYZ
MDRVVGKGNISQRCWMSTVQNAPRSASKRSSIFSTSLYPSAAFFASVDLPPLSSSSVAPQPPTPIPMAASASASAAGAGAGKSLFQTFRKFFKKPWEITGPCASPEYRSALPGALEYRQRCPATLTKDTMAVVPTSEPETVYDIKYYTRDRRRDRPPVRRTLLRKPDLERYMAAKQFDPAKDFPVPYVNTAVEEDYDAVGGGYQK